MAAEAWFALFFIVIPILIGFIYGISSVNKGPTYNPQAWVYEKDIPAIEPVFESEEERNTFVTPNQVSVLDQLADSIPRPNVYETSVPSDDMDVAINELLSAVTVVEEVPVKTLEEDQAIAKLEEVSPVMDMQEDESKHSPHVVNLDNWLSEDNKGSSVIETPTIDNSNDNDERENVVLITDVISEADPLLADETEQYQKEQSFLNIVKEEPIVEMSSPALGSKVIPFPSDYPPKVLSFSHHNLIKRRYGDIVAESITTTPAQGRSGLIDVMIGRLEVSSVGLVLHYDGSFVLLKGNIPQHTNRDTILVSGQFISPEEFFVEKWRNPEGIAHQTIVPFQELEKGTMAAYV